MLESNGWIITSINPYNNIKDYPDIELLLKEIWKQPHYVTLDADAMSKDCGSVKAANMVILGAAAPFLGLKPESIEIAVAKIFADKGEDVIQLNLKALRSGRAYTMKNI